jgi:hypothetical protein
MRMVRVQLLEADVAVQTFPRQCPSGAQYSHLPTIACSGQGRERLRRSRDGVMRKGKNPLTRQQQP